MLRNQFIHGDTGNESDSEGPARVRCALQRKKCARVSKRDQNIECQFESGALLDRWNTDGRSELSDTGTGNATEFCALQRQRRLRLRSKAKNST